MNSVGAGYLARVEANLVGVRAAPDAVYVRLIREFEAEGQTTCMFAELTPGDALKLAREIQNAVGVALAQSPSSGCLAGLFALAPGENGTQGGASPR